MLPSLAAKIAELMEIAGLSRAQATASALRARVENFSDQSHEDFAGEAWPPCNPPSKRGGLCAQRPGTTGSKPSSNRKYGQDAAKAMAGGGTDKANPKAPKDGATQGAAKPGEAKPGKPAAPKTAPVAKPTAEGSMSADVKNAHEALLAKVGKGGDKNKILDQLDDEKEHSNGSVNKALKSAIASGALKEENGKLVPGKAAASAPPPVAPATKPAAAQPVAAAAATPAEAAKTEAAAQEAVAETGSKEPEQQSPGAEVGDPHPAAPQPEPAAQGKPPLSKVQERSLREKFQPAPRSAAPPAAAPQSPAAQPVSEADKAKYDARVKRTQERLRRQPGSKPLPRMSRKQTPEQSRAKINAAVNAHGTRADIGKHINNLTRAQLAVVASRTGIRGVSKLKKGDLHGAITSAHGEIGNRKLGSREQKSSDNIRAVAEAYANGTGSQLGDHLAGMNRTQLMVAARRTGLRGVSKLNKADLGNALSDHIGASKVAGPISDPKVTAAVQARVAKPQAAAQASPPPAPASQTPQAPASPQVQQPVAQPAQKPAEPNVQAALDRMKSSTPEQVAAVAQSQGVDVAGMQPEAAKQAVASHIAGQASDEMKANAASSSSPVQQATEAMQGLWDTATDKDYSHENVYAAAAQHLNGLNKAQLREVAAGLGMSKLPGNWSRSEIAEHLTARITERRENYENMQFRPLNTDGDEESKTEDETNNAGAATPGEAAPEVAQSDNPAPEPPVAANEPPPPTASSTKQSLREKMLAKGLKAQSQAGASSDSPNLQGQGEPVADPQKEHDDLSGQIQKAEQELNRQKRHGQNRDVLVEQQNKIDGMRKRQGALKAKLAPAAQATPVAPASPAKPGPKVASDVLARFKAAQAAKRAERATPPPRDAAKEERIAGLAKNVKTADTAADAAAQRATERKAAKAPQEPAKPSLKQSTLDLKQRNEARKVRDAAASAAGKEFEGSARESQVAAGRAAAKKVGGQLRDTHKFEGSLNQVRGEEKAANVATAGRKSLRANAGQRDMLNQVGSRLPKPKQGVGTLPADSADRLVPGSSEHHTGAEGRENVAPAAPRKSIDSGSGLPQYGVNRSAPVKALEQAEPTPAEVEDRDRLLGIDDASMNKPAKQAPKPYDWSNIGELEDEGPGPEAGVPKPQRHDQALPGGLQHAGPAKRQFAPQPPATVPVRAHPSQHPAKKPGIISRILGRGKPKAAPVAAPKQTEAQQNALMRGNRKGHRRFSELPSGKPRPIRRSVKKYSETGPQLARVDDVEIFKAGMHRKKDYSLADLDQMVVNFDKLHDLIKPPIVIGHEEKQPILAGSPEEYKTDLDNTGIPAVGTVEKIWRVGATLHANFVDLPAEVKRLIDQKAYRSVSAEVYDDFEHPKGTGHGCALRRVALLGGELPQVKTLADIPKATFADQGCKYRRCTLVVQKFSEGCCGNCKKGKPCEGHPCGAEDFAEGDVYSKDSPGPGYVQVRGKRGGKLWRKSGITPAEKNPPKNSQEIMARARQAGIEQAQGKTNAMIAASVAKTAQKGKSKKSVAERLAAAGIKMANGGEKTKKLSKMCDQGENAGKPGPCPDPTKQGLLRRAAGGAGSLAWGATKLGARGLVGAVKGAANLGGTLDKSHAAIGGAAEDAFAAPGKLARKALGLKPAVKGQVKLPLLRRIGDAYSGAAEDIAVGAKRLAGKAAYAVTVAPAKWALRKAVTEPAGYALRKAGQGIKKALFSKEPLFRGHAELPKLRRHCESNPNKGGQTTPGVCPGPGADTHPDGRPKGMPRAEWHAKQGGTTPQAQYTHQQNQNNGKKNKQQNQPQGFDHLPTLKKAPIERIRHESDELEVLGAKHEPKGWLRSGLSDLGTYAKESVGLKYQPSPQGEGALKGMKSTWEKEKALYNRLHAVHGPKPAAGLRKRTTGAAIGAAAGFALGGGPHGAAAGAILGGLAAHYGPGAALPAIGKAAKATAKFIGRDIAKTASHVGMAGKAIGGVAKGTLPVLKRAKDTVKSAVSHVAKGVVHDVKAVAGDIGKGLAKLHRRGPTQEEMRAWHERKKAQETNGVSKHSELDWAHRTGERGGNIWVNGKTGEEKHQIANPGSSEKKNGPDIASVSKQPVMTRARRRKEIGLKGRLKEDAGKLASKGKESFLSHPIVNSYLAAKKLGNTNVGALAAAAPQAAIHGAAWLADKLPVIGHAKPGTMALNALSHARKSESDYWSKHGTVKGLLGRLAHAGRVGAGALAGLGADHLLGLPPGVGPAIGAAAVQYGPAIADASKRPLRKAMVAAKKFYLAHFGSDKEQAREKIKAGARSRRKLGDLSKEISRKRQSVKKVKAVARDAAARLRQQFATHSEDPLGASRQWWVRKMCEASHDWADLHGEEKFSEEELVNGLHAAAKHLNW